MALAGAGQAHRHQHLSAMADVMDCGAAVAARRAFAEAGLGAPVTLKVERDGRIREIRITTAEVAENRR